MMKHFIENSDAQKDFIREVTIEMSLEHRQVFYSLERILKWKAISWVLHYGWNSSCVGIHRISLLGKRGLELWEVARSHYLVVVWMSPPDFKHRKYIFLIQFIFTSCLAFKELNLQLYWWSLATSGVEL